MKNTNYLALLILSGGFSFACSGTVVPSEDDKEPGAGDSKGAAVLGSPDDVVSSEPAPWTLIQPCGKNDPSDDITVMSATLDGSELLISAGHGAGCAEHSYALCYEQEWAESEPVQIGLKLLHDAGGEMCEAYAMLDLRFDLAPLEEAYNDAYQADGGTISLSLDGTKVVHEFGSVESPVPTAQEIEVVADRLNSCNVVEDCKAIAVGCSSLYVNAEADTVELEKMISDSGGGAVACDLSCACGVLSCREGKCDARASDCSVTNDGETTICL